MKRFLFALILIPTLASAQTTWRFDSTTQIANHPTTLLGAPKVVSTDIGPAVHFQGGNTSGDAIFLDTNPLAGTLNYTFEVIFRPSSSGRPEQRFFHVQEAGTQSRRMFEIRIHGDKWCIDTVAVNEVPDQGSAQPDRSGIMLNCDAQHLFPLDRWYAVATVYDGKMLRTYVNGALQGETAVALIPLRAGGTSIGTRYTKRDFFTGEIFSARFTARALPIPGLLKIPQKNARP